MRLNRSTLILVVISLAVIVIALVINNNRAAAPGTPTPTVVIEGAGVLFASLVPENVVQYSVRDNVTGNFTSVTQDTGEAWRVDTLAPTDRPVDQAAAEARALEFARLNASQSFTSDAIASFGLDTPTHTFTLSTQDGAVYTVYLGDTNPDGTSRYATFDQTSVTAPTPLPAEATVESEATVEAVVAVAPEDISATAAVTPESTIEPVTLSGSRTVYLVPVTVTNGLIGIIAVPPYVPLPTAPPPGTPTPNPYSEVDQTATAQAFFESISATLTAEFTPEATAEITSEATDEAFVSTPSAESTLEVTQEAP